MSVLANRTDLHLPRKIWHICTGSIGLFLFFYLNLETKFLAKIGLCFACFAFCVELLRFKFKAINKFILKYGKILLRKNELNSFTGLPFYALGVGLSLALFQTHIAVLSIFFLVFADPLGSLIGIKFGSIKVLPNKSLEGCLSFWFISSFITFVYLSNFGVNEYNFLSFSILAGLFASCSEAVSAFKVDDNLTIPILSGIGLLLCNYFFPVFL